MMEDEVIPSLQEQVEAAERALEAAKLDLQKARQSLDSQISSRAAAAPAASVLLIDGVKLDEVSAYYDPVTATVVSKNEDARATDVTADNTSIDSCSPSGGIFRIESEGDEEDAGYREFLAFLNADDPDPPDMPNINDPEVNDPEKEVINTVKKKKTYDEDVEITQKRVHASTLRNTTDLFEIPEEASILPSDVSSIADASVSNHRMDSMPSSLCNKVMVFASSPDAIRVIEGVYHKFEKKDGVNCYSKIGLYEGKETMFSIGRWKVNNGLRKWYITGIRQDKTQGGKKDRKMAFYYAYSNEDMPPADGWMECTEGRETFLWPAYVARGCSRGNSFEYASPISIERQFSRRSTRQMLSNSFRKFNDAVTV